ncbi:MAG: quinone-dependent dihydroorotate dehydrogenase [Pseudomonadota bacterium]
MYRALRPLLFSLPAETAHDLSLGSLRALDKLHLSGLVAPTVASMPVEVMGLRFPNPVGLAAGLDKDARYLDGLAALGSGFIEVGTVTPKAQPGNPKPRMFRLSSKQAIINRMGFNNDGVQALARRVALANFDGVLGINIGKNKTTSEDEALSDYVQCLRNVYSLASYVTVNISSPNTPGLRNLQHEDQLKHLLAGLKREHSALHRQHQKYVPLTVKIAPDMDDETAVNTASIIKEEGIDGVIVSNTTVERTAVVGEKHAGEQGGLSGVPVRDDADRVLKAVADAVGGSVAIVGVGGINSGEDAARKIHLGADLVQIYTGLIYQGPKLIADSVRSIDKLRAS